MPTLLPAINTIGLSFKTARLYLLAQKEKKLLGQVSEYDGRFYQDWIVGRTKGLRKMDNGFQDLDGLSMDLDISFLRIQRCSFFIAVGNLFGFSLVSFVQWK